MRDPYVQSERGSIAGGAGRYVDGSETLRLTVFNAAASVSLALAGRMLVDDGRIVPFVHRLVPATDRSATVFDAPLPCGFLLGCQARLTGGAPISGQAFGVLSLGYGTGNGFTELEVLAAGAITSAGRLAYPGSPIIGPLAGAGAVRTIAGTDPAAGAEFSESVPTGARWRLLSLTVQFVTDATVANRFPSVVVDDGTNQLQRIAVSGAVAASTTAPITAGAFGFSGSVSGFNVLPLVGDPLILMAGYRLRSLTTALQAGDNYGPPTLHIEEWIEGA